MPIQALAEDYVARQPDRSFEVVYFDPMFMEPRKSQAALDAIRPLAFRSVLTKDLLRDARRVATRWVVIKRERSDVLEHQGFKLVRLAGAFSR